jgi:hypothetical protein
MSDTPPNAPLTDGDAPPLSLAALFIADKEIRAELFRMLAELDINFISIAQDSWHAAGREITSADVFLVAPIDPDDPKPDNVIPQNILEHLEQHPYKQLLLILKRGEDWLRYKDVRPNGMVRLPVPDAMDFRIQIASAFDTADRLRQFVARPSTETAKAERDDVGSVKIIRPDQWHVSVDGKEFGFAPGGDAPHHVMALFRLLPSLSYAQAMQYQGLENLTQGNFSVILNRMKENFGGDNLLTVRGKRETAFVVNEEFTPYFKIAYAQNGAEIFVEEKQRASLQAQMKTPEFDCRNINLYYHDKPVKLTGRSHQLVTSLLIFGKPTFDHLKELPCFVDVNKANFGVMVGRANKEFSAHGGGDLVVKEVLPLTAASYVLTETAKRRVSVRPVSTSAPLQASDSSLA